MSEQWHEKLVRLQRARGWSLRDLTNAYIAASPFHSSEQYESVERQMKRWRRGEVANPEPETRAAIARVFDLPVGDFFPDRPLALSEVPSRLSPDEFTDLVAALRTPRVGTPHLDQAEAEVERLCTAYASQDAGTLLVEVDDWMRELTRLVAEGRVSLDGHRQVIRLTGWLALLRACLLWDQGDAIGTQRARVAAEGLATDIGDGVMAAWAWEIRAWMALTEGDPAQVVAAADTGLACAPTASVAAQLWAQKAKAYARMRDPHKTEVSLDHVRQVLDACGMPANVRNHFAVDPTKASFYAMDAYRILQGSDSLADAMADTVVATSVAPDGTVISPMRLAEAQLTKAVLMARAGSSDDALLLADTALGHTRRSAPSLRLVAGEVVREVAYRAPAEAAEFRAHLASVMA